jgi:hypothetical protein
VEGVGFEPTVTLPPQWFSIASVVHEPTALLPALLALGEGLPGKIIPRISRVRQAESRPPLQSAVGDISSGSKVLRPQLPIGGSLRGGVGVVFSGGYCLKPGAALVPDFSPQPLPDELA